MLLMLLLFWFYGVRITYGQAGSPWNTGDNDYYYDPLEPEDHLPKILTRSQHFVVQPGDDLTLPCIVENLGEHSLVWRRGGNILWVRQNRTGQTILQPVSRDERISQSGTSLLLRNIEPLDESTYTCEISDTKPPRRVRHQLRVRVPPSVSPANGRLSVTIKTGKNAYLGCNATGNPEPRITWTNSDGKQMGGGPNLTIENAGPDHNGVYKCSADNGVGDPATASIRLEVMHPPAVRAEAREVYAGVGHGSLLACFVYAEPRAQVVWFRRGGAPVDPIRLKRTVQHLKRYTLQFERVHLEDLGWYTCNATNFMGNDSASIILTARPKPVKYVSRSQGDMETNYTLVWDVESYHPVLAYTVAYKNASDGDDQWINFTVPGTSFSSQYHSQSHTFTDLDAGSTYHVMVSARNEYGESDANESFSFTTLDSTGTDYPTNVQSDGEVSVVTTNQSEAIVSEVDRIPEAQEAPNSSSAASEALVNQTKREDVTKNEVSAAEGAVVHDDSSGAHELTPRERKLQMMALVTAISLSSFF